jgi:hypothetical protein
LKTDNDI